ncbi:MAG: trigger factor [Deltaproteobacteria bacterium]|nr:trigger factor [Deltaproteobacteria bacterium]
MKVQIEDISPVKKKLSIEVPAEELADMIKEAFKAVSAGAEVEGFRKGKVPENIIRQKFGKSVMGDVGSRLIEKTYPKAMKESGFKPAGSPDIEVQRFEEGSPFVYSAIVDVRPAAEIRGWRDIRVERRPVEVMDADINNTLASLRRKDVEMRDALRGASEGDVVTVDFVSSLDGKEMEDGAVKGYTFTVGEGSRFPEIEDAVKGVAAGGSATFKKAFPPGYHDNTIAGKEVLFTVTVKSVKEKVLPPVDDAFAKGLSCENLEDLRQKVKEEIKRVKEKSERDRLKKEVMDKLLAENPIDVPDSLVDMHQKRIMDSIREGVRRGMVDPLGWDLTSKDAKERCREMAVRQTRGDLILDDIADREDIKVSTEDVEKAVVEIARGQNQPPQTVFERIKKDGTLPFVAEGIRREKVIDLIIEEKKIIIP